MNKKGIHAYFSGVVQGVGFRFTAREIARRHNVKGWVKNLNDGRVELVACGNEHEVNDFLKELQVVFQRQISEQILEPWDAPCDYRGFEIRY